MNAAIKKQNKKFQIKKTSYGLGLFAKRNFKKGEYIIDYKGEKISHVEGDKRQGKYLMIYDDKFLIDGKSRKNLARYINHSCKPNCKTYMENKKIRIYTIKNISLGEEFTYNYGKEYCDAFLNPCLCEFCKNK